MVFLHLEECVPVGEYPSSPPSESVEREPEAAGVESPTVFQLGEIRDGQVTWVGMFSTESEALEAAGLSD